MDKAQQVHKGWRVGAGKSAPALIIILHAKAKKYHFICPRAGGYFARRGGSDMRLRKSFENVKFQKSLGAGAHQKAHPNFYDWRKMIKVKFFVGDKIDESFKSLPSKK